MKKFTFLLLDANVVIKLFELNLWNVLLADCDVLLSRTVAEIEAQFFVDQDGGQHAIDIAGQVAAGKTQLVDVDLPALRRFLQQFDPNYLEMLDPGEAESLAYMASCPNPCMVCSSDAIVFRVLAQMNRSDDGISLEEILSQIGAARALPTQFTRLFRQRWKKQREEERVRGIGLKRE